MKLLPKGKLKIFYTSNKRKKKINNDFKEIIMKGLGFQYFVIYFGLKYHIILFKRLDGN
jgi:hypothetical protein